MVIKVAIKRNSPHISGCFKCALDGYFGSYDAAMDEQFIDETASNDVLYYSHDTVKKFVILQILQDFNLKLSHRL